MRPVHVPVPLARPLRPAFTADRQLVLSGLKLPTEVSRGAIHVDILVAVGVSCIATALLMALIGDDDDEQ